MAEYIYSMVRARKAVGDKLILDDVTMSFLPGAKIGVVGPNGAGKSTILKIMAGLDQPSNGEAKLTPGFSVGILMQEPELDETKTVLENVQEGVGEIHGHGQIPPLLEGPGAREHRLGPGPSPAREIAALARRGEEIMSLQTQAQSRLGLRGKELDGELGGRDGDGIRGHVMIVTDALTYVDVSGIVLTSTYVNMRSWT